MSKSASSILTLLTTATALVLSLLVLLAGSGPSFLQSGDILTLNVSRLGYGTVHFNTTDGNPHNPLSSITNGVQGDINNAFDRTAADIAKQLNLSDYYSVHVMNYCKGMFEPNATVAVNGSHIKMNTTYCSPQNAFFHFNITDNVAKSLPSKISLQDIHWPSAITDAENSVRLAGVVMTVLYIIAVNLTGCTLLVALLGLLSKGGGGRLNACIDLMISTLSFLALLLASIISTVIMIKAVNLLNKYGRDIGVSATRGSTFLGMTWAATGLMLLIMLLSIVHFIKGKDSRYVSDKSQY